MNKVSDRWEKKRNRCIWNFRHPYAKLTSSLASENLRIKFAVSLTVLPPRQPASTLLGLMYIFLYKQAILWGQCFSAIQQKHSCALVVATEADLTCVVQVCFSVLQWWRAGLLRPGAPPKHKLLKTDFSFFHFLTIFLTSYSPFLQPCHFQIILILLFS